MESLGSVSFGVGFLTAFVVAAAVLFCSPLELELSPVTCSSTLAVDTSSLLLATVTSSADSAVTTDMPSGIAKRPAEDEEEELNSGNASPAYKVLKLTDSVPATVANHVKPGNWLCI